ncbi:MAG TPA: Calx-beta domain-containing protein, partial [Bacteroidia bacterium]|nr:Calx-beta domain-containing protein [Bacteroidia bacterium]
RFTAGNYLRPTIIIGDNSGTTIKKWAMNDSIQVLALTTGSGANDGTGIYGSSLSSAQEIVALYELTTDTRPSSITFVETATISGSAFSSLASFYANNVRNQDGRWGTIIRNNNANGIRKIERLSFATGAVQSSYTDSDGDWANGDDTRNPAGGSTPLYIDSVDVPLLVNTPALNINPAGFTNDFGLTYPGTPSSGSNFTIAGTNLTDTVFVSVGAPFEIRVSSNAYANDVVKLVPTGGTLTSTFLDVRFNPSTTGSFEDTVYITSAGAVTQKVMVKGTASNNPEISFNIGSVTVNEGVGSISVQVNIANANSTATTVDLVRLSGSATAGSDYTWTSPQTLTFPANSNDSIVINIPIIDDNAVEVSEILWLGFANPTNGAVLGSADSMLITITDNDYLPVNIGPITTVNTSGVLDSLNGRYEVTGVVYGSNVKTSAGGWQFTIRDNTGGVTVFSNANTFGYTVTQGDSIRVRGTIVQFNGLAELSFVDTVIVLATGRTLNAPRVTTTLGENEENDLVRFDDVTAKPGTWLSGNQYVYLNNGADSIQVRIVPNSHSLIGKLRPTTSFSIIGIGGQFDNSSPYTSGYQLFPRDTNDVIPTPDTLSAFSLLTPPSGTIDTIQGANTQVITATWEPSIPAAGINAPTYEILIDLPTGDFSSPLAAIPSNVAGTQANASLQYLTLVTLMNAQGLSGGQSLSLQWTVRATTGSYSRLANTPFTITLVRGVMAGINNAEAVMSVYPNPANGTVYVEMPELINTVTISTIEGKAVTSQQAATNKTSLDVAGLTTGIYLISVETASGVYTQRLAIQR